MTNCLEKEKYLPIVSTNEVFGIYANLATSGGEILEAGGIQIDDKGIVWDTISEPTLEKNCGSYSDGPGTGYFLAYMNGLTKNTSYFVRAYAINKYGVAYGNEVRFSTSDKIFSVLPRVITKNVTEIRSASATIGGIIEFEGTPLFTSKGVCWSINAEPTISDNVIYDSTNSLKFNLVVKGLESNTLYHAKAFATNEGGTSYGNDVSFTTLRKGYPVVIMTNISNVEMSSLSGEGNVLLDENDEVLTRGFCWSTDPEPLISNDTTVNGRGLGKFSDQISGLSYGTRYYIRAYATNNNGTAYSDVYRIETIDTGLVVKDYDGNFYNTVRLGNQTWLSSNLKTTRYQNGNPISECWAYNNNDSYVATYGRLYGRNVAINAQGACPVGWHVPSSTEWRTLATYLESKGFAFDGTIPATSDLQYASLGDNKLAKALSSDYNWGYSGVTGSPGNPDYAEIRNKTGFNAMPAGCKYPDGTFTYLGSYTYWWNYDLGGMYVPMTGGPRLEYTLTQWCLIYENPHLREVGGYSNAASIRCIKN